jgi:hypothetical protein
MLEGAKLIGAGAATIALAGAAIGIGNVFSSLFILWREIHHWLNNYLVMPFWALL